MRGPVFAPGLFSASLRGSVIYFLFTFNLFFIYFVPIYAGFFFFGSDSRGCSRAECGTSGLSCS